MLVFAIVFYLVSAWLQHGFHLVSIWFPFGFHFGFYLVSVSGFCMVTTWFPFWFLYLVSARCMVTRWFPFGFHFGFYLVSIWFLRCYKMVSNWFLYLVSVRCMVTEPNSGMGWTDDVIMMFHPLSELMRLN